MVKATAAVAAVMAVAMEVEMAVMKNLVIWNHKTMMTVKSITNKSYEMLRNDDAIKCYCIY